MKISVVMPVFNEKDTIRDIIGRVMNVDFEKELIIVDDGSKDGTREILAGIKMDGVKIIYHDKNQGKGKALKTGIKNSTGDIIIIQDADL
ncbi:MAG: glycosyltransferase family 2 protein, partial [Candidatus Omnitrophica bacterium]|nr:glycosyltransferase family 2 protein [Candidatus Omnitrophota bacterium]